MTQQLLDTKLTTILQAIRNISPPAYTLVAKNIAEACQDLSAEAHAVFVKTDISDTELFTILQELRIISRVKYLNVKRVVAATYRSLVIEAIEKNFIKFKRGGYLWFQVEPGTEDSLAYYIEEPRENIADAFMLVMPDRSHAAIFFRDKDEIAIVHRYLFKEVDVLDILQTFWDYLVPIYDDFTDEIIPLHNRSAKSDYDIPEFHDLPDDDFNDPFDDEEDML